jgi:putative ABC transport system ATP-binding protein
LEPIIVAKNLTKIYKTGTSRINALNNVDITVMSGEFVAIVGTSGSGKSTLLSLLAGLEAPTAGKISVMGHPIHRMSERQLVDFRLKHIGFIFQAYNLMPTMTALENAAFPLSCQGVKRSAREKKAAELLGAMGLKEHLQHKPTELSGGQQQRVSTARAIISEPRIVFADEPTGNLDSRTSGEIMELLKTVVRFNGTTLLLVTHDMEKAKYADRIIHISDGRIVDSVYNRVSGPSEGSMANTSLSGGNR